MSKVKNNVFLKHKLVARDLRTGNRTVVFGRDHSEVWNNALHHFPPEIVLETNPSDSPSFLAQHLNDRMMFMDVDYQDNPNILNKSLGALAASAIMAASPGNSSQNMHENTAGKTDRQISAEEKVPVAKKWTPVHLDAELIPIAHLESSFGVNTAHAPHPDGPWRTAFGALGFKPETAYEEYLRSAQLKNSYPEEKLKENFLHTFTSDPEFYNRLASQHFRYLRRNTGSDAKAAYAWRWGIGAAGKADDLTWNTDNYVQNYRRLFDRYVDNKENLVKGEYPQDIMYHYHEDSKGYPSVSAYHGTRKVGEAQFTFHLEPESDPEAPDGLGQHLKPVALKGWDLFVTPNYRGLGIGSGMYNHAAKKSGMSIVRGDVQTADGQKFWSKWGSVIPEYMSRGLVKSLDLIKPGKGKEPSKDMHELKRQDFTHLLSKDHQKQGYKLECVSKGLAQDEDVGLGEGFLGMYARLTLPKDKFDSNKFSDYHQHKERRGDYQVGHVDGLVGPTRVLELGESMVDMNHRGGKGMPLYEALYRFAHDNYNVEWIKGSYHSKTAHKVHAKLAKKHGFKYIPQPNYGPNEIFQNRLEWLKMVINSHGAFDMAYKPYEYKIAKSEPNYNREVLKDMLGFNMASPELSAVQFLLGASSKPHLESYRKARLMHGDDREAVALTTFGLPVSEQNRKAIKSVMNLSTGSMKKTEQRRIVDSPVSSAKQLAKEIQQGFDSGNIAEAELGGKHSNGSIVVETEKNGVWLLKPNAGGSSLAAGASQEISDAASREAAFSVIAESIGIYDAVKTDLVTVDKKPYAAIKMLDYTWRSVAKVDEQDHTALMEVIRKYHRDGFLHKWAILDYICGNPDRHGNNMMISLKTGTIMLIDHGGAFAGGDFAPGRDENSFVPFYLRVWTGKEVWPTLSPEQKVNFMPKLSTEGNKMLRSFVDSINPDAILQILENYKISPTPTLERLKQIQQLSVSVDLSDAICKLWVFS